MLFNHTTLLFQIPVSSSNKTDRYGHFVAVNQFELKTVEFITLVHQPSRSVAALTWFWNFKIFHLIIQFINRNCLPFART
jgi:hypothetical protein